MNKEIKFRAWIKANKRMENCVGVNPWHIHDCDRLYWKHDEVELMQYTGLKDKNGKELFEGDIVKHESFSHMVYGIIVFGKIEVNYTSAGGHQGFYIDWQNNGKNKWGYWWRQDIYYWVNEVEVIGNIYENPELLEVKDE